MLLPIAKVLEDFNSQFGTVTSDDERLMKLVDDAGTVVFQPILIVIIQ